MRVTHGKTEIITCWARAGFPVRFMLAMAMKAQSPRQDRFYPDDCATALHTPIGRRVCLLACSLLHGDSGVVLLRIPLRWTA